MRQRMALLYSLTPPRLPNKYSYDFIHCPRRSVTLIRLSNPLYSYCASQIQFSVKNKCINTILLALGNGLWRKSLLGAESALALREASFKIILKIVTVKSPTGAQLNSVLKGMIWRKAMAFWILQIIIKFIIPRKPVVGLRNIKISLKDDGLFKHFKKKKKLDNPHKI